jgi:flagellar basal-body rod modification protein FlgD
MSIFNTGLPTQASANTVAQSLLPGSPVTAKPNAATANDDSSSDASSAGDITASDFLTLLVTEMQNQDPTQPTDPNAYIQQLVGVNSLQQLISINQGLSTAEGITPTTQAVSSVVDNF